jgi:hypothetical protein
VHYGMHYGVHYLVGAEVDGPGHQDREERGVIERRGVVGHLGGAALSSLTGPKFQEPDGHMRLCSFTSSQGGGSNGPLTEGPLDDPHEPQGQAPGLP